MMKFIASSLDAAKAKARRALGDKAVIVAVRNLPSGDIEVQASDRPAPVAPAPRRAEPTFGEAARPAIDEKNGRPGSGARLNEPLEHRYSEDALARLRGKLTGGDKAKGLEAITADKSLAGLADMLRSHGAGEAFIAQLVRGAQQSRISEDFYRLESAFASAFGFAPITIAANTSLMVVGPTGAGKTSAAAKLAAAATSAGIDPFIMTADAGRAGAVEQIKTYADSLGVSFFIVETPQDVARARELRAPTGPIILDTPGVSPYDAGDIAALQCFRESSGAEPVLVLPASGDPEEFREWASAFREFGVTRAIVSKFDASRRVATALTALHDARMALAYFSESAFISEGLIPASPEFLARRMIASRPGRVT